MKKKIIILGVLFVVIVVLCKDLFAGMAVSGVVKQMTGLRLDMKLKVGIVKPVIHIKAMKLYNPPGYSQPVMMEMPELFVKYDRKVLFGGGVHLPELLVNLKEFNVEKNAQGALNIDSLKFVQEKKQGGGAPPPQEQGDFLIDKVRLQVGKVTFKDFTVNPPRNADFPLNLDETYTGVRSPQALGSLVVGRALTKTAVARLANFDMDALVRGLSVKKVSGMAAEVVNSAVGTGVRAADTQAVDAVKQLFPFKTQQQQEEKKTE